MRDRLRPRFWVESVLAAASFLFAVLTLVWKDWIELIFRVDPDNHSGSLEMSIVLVAIAVTVTFAILARIEWRRRSTATA
ncbi:MAG: hypothetical protein WBW04_00905 [Nitrolancea sp.]